MKDIRQSPPFACFMQDLGWKVVTLNSTKIYLRKFPLIGHFAKIPRPSLPIPFGQLDGLRKKYRIFRLKIAPFVKIQDKKASFLKKKLIDNGFSIEHSPFNPTTTIQIDLAQKEEGIFNSFFEAKRRGVRRAIKNGIFIKESDDLDAFIKIRQKQYRPMGFLVTNEMKILWKNFYPKNASLLLAYKQPLNNCHAELVSASPPLFERSRNKFSESEDKFGITYKPVAGILLLFYDKAAYYWHASALKEGKKLFAPTLLVWEALKIAKKKGCQIFDFEGICDERFPKASSSWKGFTKFKEGFGGEKVVFVENFKG